MRTGLESQTRCVWTRMMKLSQWRRLLGDSGRRFATGVDTPPIQCYIYATAMKLLPTDPKQSMQRVRVGLTGLATVLLLIGVASAIFSSADREAPVLADGASRPDVVANMTDGLVANDAAEKDEPIAELGIAPRTAESPTPIITPYPIPQR